MLGILDRYGSAPWHRERERVQLAILMMSGGGFEKILPLTELAIVDYRDLLVSEYPEEFQASSKTPAHEIAAIRQRDRARYEARLESGK